MTISNPREKQVTVRIKAWKLIVTRGEPEGFGTCLICENNGWLNGIGLGYRHDAKRLQGDELVHKVWCQLNKVAARIKS